MFTDRPLPLVLRPTRAPRESGRDVFLRGSNYSTRYCTVRAPGQRDDGALVLSCIPQTKKQSRSKAEAAAADPAFLTVLFLFPPPTGDHLYSTVQYCTHSTPVLPRLTRHIQGRIPAAVESVVEYSIRAWARGLRQSQGDQQFAFLRISSLSRNPPSYSRPSLCLRRADGQAFPYPCTGQSRVSLLRSASARRSLGKDSDQALGRLIHSASPRAPSLNLLFHSILSVPSSPYPPQRRLILRCLPIARSAGWPLRQR